MNEKVAPAAPASSPRDRAPVSLAQAVRALSRREVLRAIGTPATTVQSLVFPALLLLVLLAVFGSAVEAFDGLRYVQRITPALVISGAAFGSLGAVSGLFEDRASGFFDRVRLTPLRRGGGLQAVLLARSAGEHVRVAASSLVLVGLGVLLGFRFEAGWWRAIAFFVLAAVCGASFCWLGFALAVRASTMEAVVPPVTGLFLVLLFLSHGMVPVEAFPGWVQPVVRVAPSSVMIQALQRLASGGELAGPVLGALAWAAAFTLIFGSLAARGLRGEKGRAS